MAATEDATVSDGFVSDDLTTTSSTGGELYDPLAQDMIAQIEMLAIHAEADATFSTIDANGDGVISLPELQAHLQAMGFSDAAAESLFTLLDVDANGELSRDELRAAFERLSEDPTSLRAELDVAQVHAEADALFAALDSNGDGEVSSAELRGHVAGAGYEPAAAERFFAVLDANRDGAVSRDELREAFATYEAPALRLALGLGAAEADAIFSAVDANGDGSIESSELQAYLGRKGLDADAARSIFGTLDVDGDGRVSRDELRNGYVRYAALREALGLRKPTPATSVGRPRRNTKGQPLRWGRGRRQGAALTGDSP